MKDIFKLYSKTSLNSPTVGPILNGSFSGAGQFGKLEYYYNDIVRVIIWNPNITNSRGDWAICGVCRLERFNLFVKAPKFNLPGVH